MTSISSDADYASRAGHSVGIASWRGLGADIKGQRFATGAELAAALGLDWEVTTQPLISARTNTQIGSMREVVKEDGATRPTVGVVKKRWTPIQNADAFGFIPEVAGEHGLEVITGGELAGGAKTWVLTKAGEQIFPDRVLPNGERDRIEHHLLFWNSHDGSASCRIAAIPHAIWCANALASAWREAEHKWSIRHTRSAPQVLADAHRNVVKALDWMGGFGEQMIELERERFNTRQMRDYVEGLLTEVEGLITPKTVKELGLKQNGDPRTDTAVESRKRRIDKMVTLFEGEGASCRGATKLDAYQAVTEFIDHHRARKQRGGDTVKQQMARFEEAVFGYGSQRLRDAALRRLRVR